MRKAYACAKSFNISLNTIRILLFPERLTFEQCGDVILTQFSCYLHANKTPIHDVDIDIPGLILLYTHSKHLL